MSQLALKLGSYLKTTNHLAQRLISLCKINPTFLKFLLVGSVNTVIGIGMMFFFKNGLQWPYWFATFSGNTTGAFVSFFLNRAFTFRSNIPIKEGAIKFLTVILICYTLSFSVSRLLARLIFEGAYPVSPDNLAILIGTALYTITNYLGQKLFVFQSKT
jgi:putative flippase GtrA